MATRKPATRKNTFPLTLFIVGCEDTVAQIRESDEAMGLVYALEDVYGSGLTVKDALTEAEDYLTDNDHHIDDIGELTLLKVVVTVERPVDVEGGRVRLS